jgi:hypothetical protein
MPFGGRRERNDVVNRLTEFRISGSYTKDYQYQYDGNGNRVQQSEDGIPTSYAYNNANEITNAGTLTYTFDANGNELTNSGGLSYSYNAKNQTANVSSTQPVNSLDMTYSGPGQSQRLTAGPHSYNYSLLGMYSDTASSSFTSFANVQAAPTGSAAAAALKPSYSSPVQSALTHNQPGTVAQSQTSPSGSYFFARDHQGTLVHEATPSGKYYYSLSALQTGLGPNPGGLSIAAITDSTGAVVAVYLNCPTGNDIVTSGTAPNSWRLQSRYFDSETGTQLYLSIGIYDSTIGRWNQLRLMTQSSNVDLLATIGMERPQQGMDRGGRRGFAVVPFDSQEEARNAVSAILPASANVLFRGTLLAVGAEFAAPFFSNPVTAPRGLAIVGPLVTGFVDSLAGLNSAVGRYVNSQR